MLEDLWKSILCSNFDASQGGAKFELKLEHSSCVAGDAIPDYELGFVDGYKKAVVLHAIVSLLDDMVQQTNQCNKSMVCGVGAQQQQSVTSPEVEVINGEVTEQEVCDDKPLMALLQSMQYVWANWRCFEDKSEMHFDAIRARPSLTLSCALSGIAPTHCRDTQCFVLLVPMQRSCITRYPVPRGRKTETKLHRIGDAFGSSGAVQEGGTSNNEQKRIVQFVCQRLQPAREGE